MVKRAHDPQIPGYRDVGELAAPKPRAESSYGHRDLNRRAGQTKKVAERIKFVLCLDRLDGNLVLDYAARRGLDCGSVLEELLAGAIEDLHAGRDPLARAA